MKFVLVIIWHCVYMYMYMHEYGTSCAECIRYWGGGGGVQLILTLDYHVLCLEMSPDYFLAFHWLAELTVSKSDCKNLWCSSTCYKNFLSLKNGWWYSNAKRSFFFPILGTHIVGCAFVCVLSFLISLVFIRYTRVCSVSTLYNWNNVLIC